MSYSLQQVMDEFRQRILPAVLEDSETNSNFYLSWFRKHKISQPSVDDFMRATKEMREVLAWVVAPKKQGDVQMSKDSSRKNHAKASDDNFGQTQRIVSDAAAKMDLEKAKPVTPSASHSYNHTVPIRTQRPIANAICCKLRSTSCLPKPLIRLSSNPTISWLH